MSVSPEFADHLHDQLGSFGAVTIRNMFGGGGLCHDAVPFYLIANETFYLKAAASPKRKRRKKST